MNSKLRDEMTGRQFHRMGTAALSLAMTLIGVALLVQALAGEGGLVSPRLLLGLLFAAAGCARLYVEARKGRGA